jgi:hypothetical protein
MFGKQKHALQVNGQHTIPFMFLCPGKRLGKLDARIVAEHIYMPIMPQDLSHPIRHVPFIGHVTHEG